MKKIRKIDFNLLIILTLCLFFGEVDATNEFCFNPKNENICSFTVNGNTETTATPIDIRNKKKKNNYKDKKNRGKVNYDSFRQYYEKALKFYDSKAWLSAARIFEELYPLSMGTPVGDTILFLFADSYFQNRDYQMAAFHFRDYVRRYPGTDRTELAALNAVKAMYYNSPDYNVDQFVTQIAIDEVILFIQQYPNSRHIEECNEILDEMRDKLAKKDLEILRMYYEIGYYEAAQIIARNFLKTYSASKYATEAIYILIKNNYDFARKSVESKKYFRYKDCMEAFEMLQNRDPESNYMAESTKIKNDAENQIKKIEEQKK